MNKLSLMTLSALSSTVLFTGCESLNSMIAELDESRDASKAYLLGPFDEKICEMEAMVAASPDINYTTKWMISEVLPPKGNGLTEKWDAALEASSTAKIRCLEKSISIPLSREGANAWTNAIETNLAVLKDRIDVECKDAAIRREYANIRNSIIEKTPKLQTLADSLKGLSSVPEDIKTKFGDDGEHAFNEAIARYSDIDTEEAAILGAIATAQKTAIPPEELVALPASPGLNILKKDLATVRECIAKPRAALSAIEKAENDSIEFRKRINARNEELSRKGDQYKTTYEAERAKCMEEASALQHEYAQIRAAAMKELASMSADVPAEVMGTYAEGGEAELAEILKKYADIESLAKSVEGKRSDITKSYPLEELPTLGADLGVSSLKKYAESAKAKIAEGKKAMSLIKSTQTSCEKLKVRIAERNAELVQRGEKYRKAKEEARKAAEAKARAEREAKEAQEKAEREAREKALAAEFDKEYLSDVQTVTAFPELERQLYRKAILRAFKGVGGDEGLSSAAKQAGIDVKDYKKALVEDLIENNLKENLRQLSHETKTTQKISLQQLLKTL